MRSPNQSYAPFSYCADTCILESAWPWPSPGKFTWSPLGFALYCLLLASSAYHPRENLPTPVSGLAIVFTSRKICLKLRMVKPETRVGKFAQPY